MASFPKKLAQKLRTTDLLVIKKLDLEHAKPYLITNQKVLVNFGEDEYKKYKKKWNNYKSVPDIPNLASGDIYELKDEDKFIAPKNGEYSNLSRYIDREDGYDVGVFLTNYLRQVNDTLYRICRTENGDLLAFDNFYQRIIDQIGGESKSNLLTSQQLNKIYVLDQAGITRGVFVPNNFSDVKGHIVTNLLNA